MRPKLILAFAFLLHLSVASAQTDKAAYLTRNSATWNGSFKNIDKVFTPAILKNQLFMIGEGHGIAYSYDIQYDLVNYLRQKTGAKYLLVELGYLDGILLNDYLKTGDDSAYVANFNKYKGTYYYNKSVHQLFKKLHNLNKTLPDDKKIVLLPVDIEHGYRKAIKYLQDKMFTGANATTPVGLALSKLDSDNGIGKDLAAEIIRIYPLYKADIETYKKALADRFGDADFLMRNTYEMLNIALKKAPDARRDSVMLENFKVYKQRYNLKDQKIVGLFGGFHVKQTDQPNDIRFAALLKRSGAVKGICSALMVYNGGFIMMPKGGNDTTKTGNLYKQVANTYDYFTGSFTDGDLLGPFNNGNKAVLFNLTGKSSPFKRQKSFLMEKDQYANVDEMFQLLILINNSPATEPLTGEMDK